MIPHQTLEELIRESKKALREDTALVEALQRLVRNPDFHVYPVKVLGDRIEKFGVELTAPAGSMDGLVRSEWVKGALCGLCLARDLPSIIISAMDDSRAQETTS